MKNRETEQLNNIGKRLELHEAEEICTLIYTSDYEKIPQDVQNTTWNTYLQFTGEDIESSGSSITDSVIKLNFSLYHKIFVVAFAQALWLSLDMNGKFVPEDFSPKDIEWKNKMVVKGNSFLKNHAFEGAFLKAIIKKNVNTIIYCGLRYLVNTKTDGDAVSSMEAKNIIDDISFVAFMMSGLTPIEFVNMFPISKRYHGIKNYFYARDMMYCLPQNRPIGENIFNVLIDYSNPLITAFAVILMKNFEKLRKVEDICELIEKWCWKNKIQTCKVNTTDSQETEFCLIRLQKNPEL